MDNYESTVQQNLQSSRPCGSIKTAYKWRLFEKVLHESRTTNSNSKLV